MSYIKNHSSSEKDTSKIEITATTPASGLSVRGKNILDNDSATRIGYDSACEQAYDPNSNPNGIINLGTAENSTMTEMVTKFINENVNFEPADVNYGLGPWGSPRLRTAMAAHLNRYFKPWRPVDKSELVFSSGIAAFFDNLGFALFDPGDFILLGRPNYQAIEIQFKMKAKVESLYVSFADADQFQIEAVKIYEEHLIKAESEGKRIKAIIICNPHNPLGKCYTQEAIIGYMRLCQTYKIHLIMDEVYALSTYSNPEVNDTVPFRSILSIPNLDDYIDPNYVHIIYSLSKDLACSGLRVGFTWSRNRDLLYALSPQTYFGWTSNFIEKVILTMLEHNDWMEYYVSENRKNLERHASTARNLLDEYQIPFSRGSYAGFFLWLDIAKYFSKNDETKEYSWADEQALRKEMAASGVSFTAGEVMKNEKPGYFRFCFVKNEAEIRLGLERFVTALNSVQENINKMNVVSLN